jgi:hypothetical protein
VRNQRRLFRTCPRSGLIQWMRFALIVLCVMVALGMAEASASAYTVGPPSPWSIEASERMAKEAVERREHEEAEAAARKAAEERAPVEAREREERERAAVEANQRQEVEKSEQQARELEAQSVACRVPRLSGHSLAAARRLLNASHCALGHVRGRHAGHAAQRIVGQSIKAGASRPSGTLVAVTLRQRSR